MSTSVPRTHVTRSLTEKEMALIRDRDDRLERYIRTARFIQSKWFMLAGAVAIGIFILAIYLVSR
ncbi:MAG: hypothetical protein IH630_04190 [Thermoplasmata archaeon]|nr:hypothetical protein [Thermoplasmata archaeon]TFG67230.1 MAG: hypothetical protein E4H25_07750 [Methanomassiliicoccus sp.]